MTNNKIDIILFLEAHKDHEADVAMGTLIRFEEAAARAMRELANSMKQKESPASRQSTYQELLGAALAVGARDLCDHTYRLIASIQNDDPGRVSAMELSWISTLEQTRAANVALFQACEFFGRALNGKKLPPIQAEEQKP